MFRRFLFAELRDRLSRSHTPLPFPASLHSIFKAQSKNRMEEFVMATINLRDFYPWYMQDEFVEVPEVVAAELLAARRYERQHARRMQRNNSQYSLDAEDGIENAVLYHDMSPWAVIEMMERHCRLCRALNSLPEIQGRRVEAHYLLGKSKREIAESEGVSVSSVDESISRGLRAMKIFLRKFE
jgi:RNA polymerase sigma-70 factor (ECF subfamily)